MHAQNDSRETLYWPADSRRDWVHSGLRHSEPGRSALLLGGTKVRLMSWGASGDTFRNLPDGSRRDCV